MERRFFQFTREEGGWPRIITSAEPSEEERRNLPVAVLAVLEYEPKENGLPVAGEFKRVSQVEDKIVDRMEALGAVHLGHITGENSMVVLFHAKEEPPPAVQGTTGDGITFNAKLQSQIDPSWSWFDREIKPTPLEAERSENMPLHRRLQEQGDDASKPRRVDFTSFFPTEADREAFISEVMHEGFLTDDESLSLCDAAPLPFMADMRFITTVGPPEMAEHCLYIREATARHQGVFDGWGCPIQA